MPNCHKNQPHARMYVRLHKFEKQLVVSGSLVSATATKRGEDKEEIYFGSFLPLLEPKRSSNGGVLDTSKLQPNSALEQLRS
jgi:hypothetical protein